MGQRRESAIDSYYHVYNRGVDKRVVFPTGADLRRFIDCMIAFNTEKPVGSLLELRSRKTKEGNKTRKLVDIICFCLNPNHFHLLLRQNIEGGMAQLMQRLGGYTQYFNRKYKRSGTLFEGKYKSVLINTNEYLLHVSAYINLNNQVHRIGSRRANSSWDEFVGGRKGICSKKIILSQFRTPSEYREFAMASLQDILERKTLIKELEAMILE